MKGEVVLPERVAYHLHLIPQGWGLSLKRDRSNDDRSSSRPYERIRGVEIPHRAMKRTSPWHPRFYR
jgi:hypothetical protein